MQIPRHVAIIMDGNGRWAKQSHVPRAQGHRAGAKALRKTIDNAYDIGIEYLTVYAFSVDNWKRSKEEVDSLMDLMREFLKKQSEEIKKRDIRLIVIGRKQGLPKDIIEAIEKIEDETKDKEKLKLVLALNYGGRTEIVDAVKSIGKKLLEGKISPDDINEDLIRMHLYTKDIPDPDLFIRTSGEMRLSNFLLWQLSYTELWITPVYWPDFGKKELMKAIEAYNKRERRFGGRTDAK